MTTNPTWSTSCPDWGSRLVKRQSIIPPPVFANEGERALAIFKRLQITDLGKTVADPAFEGGYRSPTFGEACEEWVFDFVRAVFGGHNPQTGEQLIREYGLLISKKNSKSTLAAGIMLTALLMCWRADEEHLIVAPTKEVADNSFTPAAAMVQADPELTDMLNVQPHLRTITHRVNGATLRVVAATVKAVAGKKAGRVLVDELWVFGMMDNADSMLMEATGGLVSRPEGWVIYLTTQSDEPPAGVFKKKLDYWRDIRDGVITNPAVLPVLYEFPAEMIKSKAYLDPANAYITNPNIGRSVSEAFIRSGLMENTNKRDGSFQKWIAKHLNIQIGLSLRADRWAGADYWESRGDALLTLAALVDRCEVVVAGIDGGGLDDLLALVVMGRERGTGQWLHWAHAWCHPIALERNEEVAPRLRDFAEAGLLTIVEKPGDDITELVNLLAPLRTEGKFPEKNAVGVDAAGISAIVQALEAAEFTADQIVAVSQGWRLNGAILTVERKLAGAQLTHGGTALMAWCVGNARTVQVGNALAINKAVSGKAKIDPVMATFDAATLLALNPVAVRRKLILAVAGG